MKGNPKNKYKRHHSNQSTDPYDCSKNYDYYSVSHKNHSTNGYQGKYHSNESTNGYQRSYHDNESTNSYQRSYHDNESTNSYQGSYHSNDSTNGYQRSYHDNESTNGYQGKYHNSESANSCQGKYHSNESNNGYQRSYHSNESTNGYQGKYHSNESTSGYQRSYNTSKAAGNSVNRQKNLFGNSIIYRTSQNDRKNDKYLNKYQQKISVSYNNNISHSSKDYLFQSSFNDRKVFMNSKRFAKKFPDRWFNYSKMGNLIENTRFIPIKVPLKDFLFKGIDEEEHFTYDHMIKMVKEKGKEIGMVIDLCNTMKYQDNNFIKKNKEIQFVKIQIPGHEIPVDDLFDKFTQAVTDFEKMNSENDKVILVHCTHGVNRTGLLICNYLVRKLDYQPNEAIKAFSLARGFKIERKNYLNFICSLKD